ncbi:PDC sensor domain-containing protein [Alteromonas profundi]|nr:cache domain-containing protein [Alteromonas profundi]
MFYDSFIEREHAINAAINQAVNTAKTHSKVQANLIDKTRLFLKNLSEFEAVQQPSSPQCSSFLASVLKVNSNYVNIGVPRDGGQLLCNAQPMKSAINVYDRPYIQKAIASRDFSIGEFQIDRATNLASVNFAYPVIDSEQGTLVGLVVAVISLQWWSEILSESYLPEHTVAFITDSENNIIAAYPTNENLLGAHLEAINSASERTIPVTDGTAFLSNGPYQRVYVKETANKSRSLTLS